MRDGPPLAGARQRCARVATHLRDLDAEVAAFLAAAPFTVVSNAAGTRYEVRVDAEPPDHWRPLIGECGYQMRAALDNAVYDLALLSHRSPSPHTAFPICRDKKGFRRSTRTALADLDPMAVKSVKKVQPYRRAESGRVALTRHPLVILDSLLRRDHRYPPRISGAVVRGPIGAPTDDQHLLEVELGPFKHGAVVATASEGSRQARCHGSWTFGIAFLDGALHGLEVVAALSGMLDAITNQVLPSLERAVGTDVAS